MTVILNAANLAIFFLFYDYFLNDKGVIPILFFRDMTYE
jgi:hypothetical protein